MFRLPTSSEWELACRAGSKKRFTRLADGREIVRETLDDVAWYGDNSGGRHHPVGEKLPNAFGLYDVLGNVWEYCLDWRDVNYYSGLVGTVTVNPKGQNSGSERIKRGGSYENPSSGGAFRFAKRAGESPTSTSVSGVGARVVAPLTLKW